MSLTTNWSEVRLLSGREQAQAWHAFIDRYRAFVTATLRRRIWGKERAAQASDEFWAHLYQSELLARLPTGIRFRAYLTGTLRNYAFDWRRRNDPKSKEVLHDGLPAVEDALPEDEELRLWGQQLLHLAMQRLERTQPRWAVALRRFYGLRERPLAQPEARVGAWELAEELQLPSDDLNALHQLLFRARRGLRECLVEEVRDTVNSRPELKEELAMVFRSLGTSIPGLLEPERP